MSLIRVMLKDLLLIIRDRSAFVGLILVPIIVIFFVAESQSKRGGKTILFPVVNEDQGPVATALLKTLREHLDVREVDREDAIRIVRDQNKAPATLILPAGLSKRYLTERTTSIELLTDPAQWTALQTVKVAFLLADRETASLADPFREDLLKLEERNLTGRRLKFSSVEQNVPGFSIMFVLLSLVYGVAFGLRDEEAWGTNARLAVAPVSPTVVLAGKLLARGVIAAGQLLLLLLFGHFAYHVSLGRSPILLAFVVLVIALSMACFSVVVAAVARTREQILPVGLAVVFALASLGGLFWPYSDLPKWMQVIARGAITTWSRFSIDDIMLRDRGLLEIAPKLLILVLYGVASFAIGSRIFRYADG